MEISFDKLQLCFASDVFFQKALAIYLCVEAEYRNFNGFEHFKYVVLGYQFTMRRSHPPL